MHPEEFVIVSKMNKENTLFPSKPENVVVVDEWYIIRSSLLMNSLGNIKYSISYLEYEYVNW